MPENGGVFNKGPSLLGWRTGKRITALWKFERCIAMGRIVAGEIAVSTILIGNHFPVLTFVWDVILG